MSFFAEGELSFSVVFCHFGLFLEIGLQLELLLIGVAEAMPVGFPHDRERRRAVGEILGQLQGFGHETIAIAHSTDQSPFQGLLCREPLCEHGEFHGPGFADETRQEIGGAAVRDKADPAKSLEEIGAASGDDHIGAEGQAHAYTGRGPVDRGNIRHSKISQTNEQGMVPFFEHARLVRISVIF